MIVVMVRIPVGSPEEGARLQERFLSRPGLVDSQPGFMGFELLKGEHEYVSVTRWASREHLDNWMAGEAHAQAHTRAATPITGGHPHGEGGDRSAARGAPMESSVTIYEVVIPEGAGR